MIRFVAGYLNAAAYLATIALGLRGDIPAATVMLSVAIVAIMLWVAIYKS